MPSIGKQAVQDANLLEQGGSALWRCAGKDVILSNSQSHAIETTLFSVKTRKALLELLHTLTPLRVPFYRHGGGGGGERC